MREFTVEEIIDYADKLLIGLSDEEAKSIKEEFKVINQNIMKIEEVPNIKKSRVATSPFDLYLADFRKDEPEESVIISDLLKNSGDTYDREVKVPKVVG